MQSLLSKLHMHKKFILYSEVVFKNIVKFKKWLQIMQKKKKNDRA